MVVDLAPLAGVKRSGIYALSVPCMKEPKIIKVGKAKDLRARIECPAELKAQTVHLADPDPYLGCPGDSENDEMRVRQLRSRSTTSETHRDVSSAAAMVNLPIPHPAATTPTAAETTLVHSQINQQNSTREQEWYDSYNSPADERFKARN